MNSCLILIVKVSVTRQLRQGDNLMKVCIFLNNANSVSEVFTPSFVFTCDDCVKLNSFEKHRIIYISTRQYYFEESIEALQYYLENRYQLAYRWQIHLFTSEWGTNLHILTPYHRALKVEERLAYASINLEKKHYYETSMRCFLRFLQGMRDMRNGCQAIRSDPLSALKFWQKFIKKITSHFPKLNLGSLLIFFGKKNNKWFNEHSRPTFPSTATLIGWKITKTELCVHYSITEIDRKSVV